MWISELESADIVHEKLLPMRAAMQTHVIGQQYEAGMVEKYIPSFISGSITA